MRLLRAVAKSLCGYFVGINRSLSREKVHRHLAQIRNRATGLEMHMLYVNMLYICCLLRDFNVGQKRMTYSTGLGDRLPTNWHNLSGYGKSGGRGAKAP